MHNISSKGDFMHVYAHTHTYTHTYILTHSPAKIHLHTHTHTQHLHTYTPAQAHLHKHTCTHSYTYTYLCTHTCTHTQACTDWLLSIAFTLLTIPLLAEALNYNTWQIILQFLLWFKPPPYYPDLRRFWRRFWIQNFKMATKLLHTNMCMAGYLGKLDIA